MALATVALSFLLTAAVIVVTGTMLARSGDVIAARTGLGGVWMGSVFVALATSLPEITTDIAAVRMGAPDLAAGDLFGSSMANMLILALVSLAPGGSDLFRRATLDHVLFAALAIVLTGIAALSVLARSTVSFLGVGPGSLALLVTYAVGSRAAFVHSTIARAAVETIEMSGESADPPVPSRADPPAVSDSLEATVDEESIGADIHAAPSLRRAIMTFLGASAVILIVAPRFARSAEAIADITGVGSMFIGTWLVGLATSLPELATSVAAVRLRAYDLAVGNLFGSNALNMTIFVLLDAVHRDGPILGVVDPAHVLSALVAIVLMAIAVAALVYRARGRLTMFEPSSALIILGYVLGLVLIFQRAVGG